MEILVGNGFYMFGKQDEYWELGFPNDLSNSKARELISAIINFYKYSKELEKIQSKYNYYLESINKINDNR